MAKHQRRHPASPPPHEKIVLVELIAPADIVTHFARIVSPQNAEVLRFLETHPFLLPLLDEQITVPRFLPDATLRYDIFDDPEDGVTRKLAVVIETVGAPEVVADQFYRLVQEWWVAQLPRTKQAMLLAVA